MPDFSRARAVLFDLFHTLVSLEVSQAPGPAISEVLGVDRKRWWDIWSGDSDDYVLGRKRYEDVLPAKARIANPNVTDDQLRQCLAIRPAKFHHALLHVEPETLSALAHLRSLGLRLGLVSNCGRDEVAAWPESPLSHLFDTTAFSCDVHLKKPDPAIYHLAAERLGVKPEECLFVGDGGADELSGARNARMTPVLLTRHLEVMAPHRIATARAQVELEVHTVSDLAALLAVRAP